MSYPTPFVLRLADSDAKKVASGELVAELQNGKRLQEPKLWNDFYRGVMYQSLSGKVDGINFTWPVCGCGVKQRIRACLP